MIIRHPGKTALDLDLRPERRGQVMAMLRAELLPSDDGSSPLYGGAAAGDVLPADGMRAGK